MSVASTLRRAPADFAALILRPRAFVQTWRQSGSSWTSSFALLVCCAIAAALLFAAHHLAFGSMEESVKKASGLGPPTAAPANRTTPTTSPKFDSLGARISIGAGVDFPDGLPLERPQLALFYFGATYITFSGIRPVSPIVMPMGLFLIAACAFLSVLCMHPPAGYLGGRGQAAELMRLTLDVYSLLGLFMSMVVVVVAILFIHIIPLTGWAFLIAWVLGVGLVVIVVGGRSVFLALAEYYALKKRRLLLAVVISWPLASVLGIPVILATVYGALGSASLLGIVP